MDPILEGVNAYMLNVAKKQIKVAFEQSEREVECLCQRTREGMKTARLAGKQIGAVPGKRLHTKEADRAKEAILKHSRAFGGTLTDKEVMKVAGVSHNTLAKYKRQLLAEREAAV